MSEPLRVMTFNIRGYYHPDDGVNQWEHREGLNVATIRRTAPHLIGMQEVQTGNLKAYDRALPEYHWLAWPEYGNQKPFEWPAIYWIRFRDLGTGAEFVHANTHLDHRSEHARFEGSRLIIDRLTHLDDVAQPSPAVQRPLPQIVTGDFNDVPGSRTYRAWTEAGYADAHVAAGCSGDPHESYTNHGWRGYPFGRDDDAPQRIDWIMVRGVNVRACAIVRDGAPPVWPSDHFPVVAEVSVGAV